MLVCPKSPREDRGDFGQGLTANISECNNQPELSVYNMWCSYMVLTNPHMRPRIEFIIMKIFMKIMKICPKSPRVTVFKLVSFLPEHNSVNFGWKCSQIGKFATVVALECQKKGRGGGQAGARSYMCVWGGGGGGGSWQANRQKEAKTHTSTNTWNNKQKSGSKTYDCWLGVGRSDKSPNAPPPPNDFQTLTLAIFIQSLAVSPGIVMSLPAWRKKEK